jgi:YfiH family protein
MNISFTKRTGGVSHGAFASLNLGDHVGDSPEDVATNRKILADSVGPTQFMNQVHGNRIAVIEQISDEVPTADSLITGIPGITLAVMTADCIPLLLHSRESVAAVHVGRKGLVNDVAIKTVELMREMGATTISAVLGPSICGKCYEVSEDIFNEVIQLHPLAASRTAKNTLSLDLPAALSAALTALGVSVERRDECTVEDSSYFSYRRDGITGRHVGVISL